MEYAAPLRGLAQVKTSKIIGAFLAPIAGVTVGAFAFALTGALLHLEIYRTWGLFTHWLAFYLLFGLLPAYVAEIIAITTLERRVAGLARPFLGAVLIGAGFGGTLVAGVWGVLFGWSAVLGTFPSGALGGAAAGAAYWAFRGGAVRRLTCGGAHSR